MEDLLGFFLFYGAAIIVIAIIVIDLLSRTKNTRSFIQWTIVILLSIWQVGCWRGMSNFNGAFGNTRDMPVYEIAFVVITVVWLLFRITMYLIRRREK